MAELQQLDGDVLYKSIDAEMPIITRVGPEPASGDEASKIESYPHQINEEVTPEDLKRHYELNDHMYHALLKPHVEKLIAEHVAVGADLMEVPALVERPAMERVERKLKRIDDGEDIELTEQDAAALLDADKPGIIFSYEKYFTSFSQENAEQFFKARSGGFVLFCHDKFHAIDDDWLFEKCMLDSADLVYLSNYRNSLSVDAATEQRCLEAALNASRQTIRYQLLKYPELFKSMSVQQIIEAYDDNGDLTMAANQLTSYKKVDEQWLLERLYEDEKYVAIAENLGKYQQFKSADILSRLPIDQCVEEIIRNLDVIDSVPPGDELLKVILPDYAHSRNVKHLLKFYEPDAIRQLLIDGGEYDPLFDMPEEFKGTDWNALIQDALQGDYEFADISKSLSKMSHLNPQTAELFIGSGHVTEVMSAITAFDNLTQEGVAVLALRHGHLDKYRKLMPEKGVSVPADLLAQYEYAYGCEQTSDNFLAYRDLVLQQPEAERPEFFRKVNNLFGAVTTQRVFSGVYSMVNEESIPGEIADLGVTETGWQGVEQLRGAIDAYRSEFLSARISSETEHKLLESPLLRDVLMKFVSYRSAGFGRTDEASFEEIIRNRVEAVRDGSAVVDGPAENYPDSVVYHVELLEDAELTNDVLHRYETLHEDIKDALRALERPQGFKLLIDDLHGSIQEIIDRYDRIEDTVPKTEKNPARRIEYMRKKQAQLRSYLTEVQNGEPQAQRFVLNSPADVRRSFSELEQYEELHADMRKLLYAWAIKKNPQMRETMESLPEEPTIQDVATMRDFIDHLVLQETYGDYFTDKKAAGRFKKMSSTRAFDEALINQQKFAKRSAENTVQFVASKGLMLELSGQLASVCWADKMESIGTSHPNFSALIMKKNPGTPEEELVGAALLIDTFEQATGRRVALLRGINPTDNFINHADVGQFYDALTDYVKQIAEAEDSIAAVVVDDHVGGAGSNRQAVHAQLMNTTDMQRKIVVDPHMTTFNNYNPSQMSYRL